MKWLMNKEEYRDMFLAEENMWWYVALRDLIAYYAKTYNKKSKILDAGCGTGKTMFYLSEKGYTVSGVDYSKDALSFARKRGLKSIQHASVVKLPFSSNHFDLVLCMDVLGILSKKELETAIAEFHRVLRPGGKLVIQCAALEWLRSQHDTVTNISYRYKKKEFEHFFSSSEWKITKSSYRVTFLFPLIASVKLFKKFTNKQEVEAKTDQFTPPKIINSLLLSIQLLENKVFRRVNLPIGTSLFIVVEKV